MLGFCRRCTCIVAATRTVRDNSTRSSCIYEVARNALMWVLVECLFPLPGGVPPLGMPMSSMSSMSPPVFPAAAGRSSPGRQRVVARAFDFEFVGELPQILHGFFQGRCQIRLMIRDPSGECVGYFA